MTKIEKQLKELWGKVGFIVNLSQMVEYNLANILAFDEILREFGARDSMYVLEYSEFAEKSNFWYFKLSKKSLGYALIRAKTIKYFTKESETLLSQVIEKRNYVIHKLFKEDLTKKKLDTDPSFYFDELEDIIDLLYSVNNDLIEIFKNQKTEHKCIW